MLSNFQLENQALLQSFLIGQPELRGIMQSPRMQQLRQRVIASYHLGPLDPAETQAYVEHRLKHVGWKGDPRFEPGCFDVIHARTAGIPRRINTLCNRLLLAGYLGERHVLNTGDVEAIAREILDELGPDAEFPPVAIVGGTSGAEKPLSTRMDAGTLRMHFDHIEQRLERLEKTVAAAIDLLHALLHPDKANRPGAPGAR